ncbi:MAG TPA: hypothetical protein VFH58_14180 [Acidimicrobiales bacterium]|nr:hypothetical protein [Acidimicrobiales bacterium]
MRLRVGLVTGALALSLALVGCGSSTSSKTGAPSTTATSSTTAAPSTTVPTAAQLQARLLGAGDVGAGWQAGENITPEDLSSIAHANPCGDDKIDPAVAKRLTAVTGMQFEPADRSYEHFIELVVTGDPTQLDSDLHALMADLESCPAVKDLSIPKLGDQQAAYVMTAEESANAVWHVRNAVVRIGPVAVVVGMTEVLPSAQATPQISDETFTKVLRTAVTKVSGSTLVP